MENKFDELNEGILNEKDRENPHKVEHYVIERLEQMIETTKEIEDEKAEYKVVTSYLNDIQTLEGLTEEEKKPITDIASNIVALNKTRYELMHSEKKIADVQFAQMQQEESDIPNAIKRLQSNEAYLETIRRDMKYLEREKGEWQLYQEILSHDRVKMQKFMYVAAGLSVTAALILLITQIILGTDMRLIWMILIFIAVLGICLPYLKMMNDRTESRRAKANADKAITLLNKVKIKYVNMTNAVDYACEKYHVRNGKELEYIWECYMDAVKQKEKFEQNSDDIDYFNNRMIRELSAYRLYDSRVWIPQAAALIDHKEMVEITHNLVMRRQKLRSRMEYNAGILKEQRTEVAKFMEEMPEMRPQIQDILDSVDRLSRP
ncbi:hypothetical protein DWX81_01145 [Roseburia inulinivorans]|nr:hypothetical protein DWX81_01145 [Roseburia inulinivorans]